MAAERKRLVEVEGGPGELSMLFEISQILDSSLDLRTVVEPVLEAHHPLPGDEVRDPHPAEQADR